MSSAFSYSCASQLISSVIILLTQICRGSQMTMMTEGDVYVINAGETITLGCEFRATSSSNYNLFDYPVLWRKYQLTENTLVNIMGSIKKPYQSEGRFDVKFSDTSPRYRLEVAIHEVTQADSGNYTCEVRAPQSKIIGRITHYVYVRAPVWSLTLTSDNTSSYPDVSRDASPPGIPSLTLTEKQSVSVQCQALGGYPPPSLEVFLNSADVSDQFQFTHTADLTGDKGLRTIVYDTRRISHTFTAAAEDDGKKLRCIAAVPGLKSNITFVTLNVLYGPRIQCHRSGAYVGDRNVDMKCEIRSKPALVNLLWIINSNGTSISEVGRMRGGYWIKKNERDDGVTETQLFVRQARLSSFRTYSLVAENKVGVTKEDVELFQKDKITNKQHIADNERRSSRTQLHNVSTTTTCFFHQGYLILLVYVLSESLAI